MLGAEEGRACREENVNARRPTNFTSIAESVAIVMFLAIAAHLRDICACQRRTALEKNIADVYRAAA